MNTKHERLLKLKGLTGKGYRRLAQMLGADSADTIDKQKASIDQFIGDLNNELEIGMDYANRQPPDLVSLDNLHSAVSKMREILSESWMRDPE